jgi:isopenicillin N synthase-like dioxygenase
MDLTPPARSFDQGYCGIGKEKVRGQTCMKESFDFGNLGDESFGSWTTEEQLLGFRDFAAHFYQVREYILNLYTIEIDNNQDCFQLVNQLLACLSMALGLGSTESLGQHHTGSMITSSLLHYPTVPLEQIRAGDVVRNPAHSDFGTISLLFQNDIGGLQVADMSSTNKTSSNAVNESAKFLDVKPNPELILVNLGYLLMRWTNGWWKNTVHRVSEPPSADGREVNEGLKEEMASERYSIAFFSFVDVKTNIEPFGSCYDEQVPKNWESINAGKYLLKKRAGIYS